MCSSQYAQFSVCHPPPKKNGCGFVFSRSRFSGSYFNRRSSFPTRAETPVTRPLCVNPLRSIIDELFMDITPLPLLPQVPATLTPSDSRRKSPCQDWVGGALAGVSPYCTRPLCARYRFPPGRQFPGRLACISALIRSTEGRMCAASRCALVCGVRQR